MGLLGRFKPRVATVENGADVGPTLNAFFDGPFYDHIRVHKKRPEHDRLTYNKHCRDSIGHHRIAELDNAIMDA
jgi:hypothetical protein